MASSKLEQKKITMHRKDYPKVLEYANENRIEGCFNDVTVTVGEISIPANRMILACSSKVFEKMFKTKMKERYASVVNITADVEPSSVKTLIDFIYTSEITINNENVFPIIAAADYLQLEEVKEFCSEFLKSLLTTENCFFILAAADLHCVESLQKSCHHMITNKFEKCIQNNDFKAFTNDCLMSCISKIDPNQRNEALVYDAIVT